MTINPITEAQAQRFRRLAWPMLPLVLRAAHYLTHNSDLAEDLAQETMIKAMRAIDSYREGTDMRAWLLTILRRTHIDWLRVERNRPIQLSLDAEDVDIPDDHGVKAGQYDHEWREPEELMNQFDDDSIIAALQALPEDIRWTLLLVDIEQMDQADVASVLDVAIGTIKSRAHRGRAMLRDQLYATAVDRGWVGAKEGSR
jgi:RNA polymerase sigma-70 factor (ECF subfamily)